MLPRESQCRGRGESTEVMIQQRERKTQSNLGATLRQAIGKPFIPNDIP